MNYKFIFIILLVIVAAFPNFAKEKINSTFWFNVAVEGLDVVSYFTEGKPAKGLEKYQTEWMGALWRFSSEKHLNLFKKTPTQYQPQYGGYCAWAMREGKYAGIDASAWTIRNGKLYLNYNAKIQSDWSDSVTKNIERADQHWTRIINKN